MPLGLREWPPLALRVGVVGLLPLPLASREGPRESFRRSARALPSRDGPALSADDSSCTISHDDAVRIVEKVRIASTCIRAARY